MFVPINFLHPIPKWNITGILQQKGLFQNETIFDYYVFVHSLDNPIIYVEKG